MYVTNTNTATLLKWGKTTVSKQHISLGCCKYKLHWAGMIKGQVSRRQRIVKAGLFLEQADSEIMEWAYQGTNSKYWKCSGDDEKLYIYSLITK